MLDEFFLFKLFPFYVRTTCGIQMSPWFRGLMMDLAYNAAHRHGERQSRKQAKAGTPRG